MIYKENSTEDRTLFAIDIGKKYNKIPAQFTHGKSRKIDTP